MDFIGDTKIDWIKYRWYFIAVSVVIMAVGAADIARKGGLQYGIDFSEGTLVTAKFASSPDIESIRTGLQEEGLGDAVIQRYDDASLNQVMIRVERATGSNNEELDSTANAILAKLRTTFPDNPLVDSSTEIVGPVVGQELRRKARNATILALLTILAYIAFRFELVYGVGATLAVLHDILVTLALTSIFNFEISLNVIAAFLTLVGYSVNDTIVIFDRVRENRRLVRRQSLAEIMNLSINQTLRRTILTSGLTFLAVMALYIWGGQVLRGFAFVLVCMAVVGTYSSVAIASPVVLWWRSLRDKPAGTAGKSRKAQKKEAAGTARV